jgi:hypothetical protein
MEVQFGFGQKAVNPQLCIFSDLVDFLLLVNFQDELRLGDISMEYKRHRQVSCPLPCFSLFSGIH